MRGPQSWSDSIRSMAAPRAANVPEAPVLSVARADGTRPDGGTVALPTRSSWVAQGRTSRRRCCCLIFVELIQRHRRGRSAMTTASARFTAARIEKQPGWRSASSLAPHRALSAKWHGARRALDALSWERIGAALGLTVPQLFLVDALRRAGASPLRKALPFRSNCPGRVHQLLHPQLRVRQHIARHDPVRLYAPLG
jgi:hypothetical protein